MKSQKSPHRVKANSIRRGSWLLPGVEDRYVRSTTRVRSGGNRLDRACQSAGRGGRQRDRSVQAAAANRRRGVWPGLHGRTGEAGPPHRRAQDHQAGHGFGRGDRAVRIGTPGPGVNGPPERGQGARRRRHQVRPSLLRDGARQRRADHRVLRQEPLLARGSTEAVSRRLSCDSARASEGDHPPRYQAVQRPGDSARRRARGEGDRLRRRQGDRPEADRADAVYRARPDGRHAGVHEPRTGGDERTRYRYADRRLFAGSAALRTVDRDDAARGRAAPAGRLCRDAADDLRARFRRVPARGSRRSRTRRPFSPDIGAWT